MQKLSLKTEYAFGIDSLQTLSDYLLKHEHKKVLLVCGKHSIKVSGLFDEISNLLAQNHIEMVTYFGIKGNPEDTDVMKAAELGFNEQVTAIIAAGGGSVMDSAKIIGIMIANRNIPSVRALNDNYQLAQNPCLPIVAIPTTAATASENNGNSVINLTDGAKVEKMPFWFASGIPQLAIENSQYIGSNSDWNLASGMFDIVAHIIDQYLGVKTFGWTQEYLFANLRNLLKYARRYLNDRHDTEAADNVLWTSTMALNAFTSFGGQQDWNLHCMEHELSAKWDVTHGAGLALLTPTYLRVCLELGDKYRVKLTTMAQEVFKVDTPEAMITALEQFIRDLGLPINWLELNNMDHNPTNAEMREIAHYVGTMPRNKELYVNLTEDLIYEILTRVPRN
ncbi:iron-containing alcohol dehydrogenase [Ureaplasma ceti]|uniref:Iron-containing alcohol dehydrogenase n=1 Tax=Ureaplasma ceti TaxID=3119530 RepID=A0ABP9UA31_9BACT